MSPITNPYTPGAGTQPRELAGRDSLRESVRINLERLRIGNTAKATVMVGLRGVGKTVLLDRIMLDAAANGIACVRVEVPESKSLPAVLLPEIRLALIKLSKALASQEFAKKGLRALAGFVKGLKFKYADMEVNLDYTSEIGLADNGDLDSDLSALLAQCGEAARASNSVFCLFVDELQYVKSDQFGALISALHHCAQKGLPVTMVAAGLPQLLAMAAEAKSYAERLFDFPVVDTLPAAAANDVLSKPALQLGVTFESAALGMIYKKTAGYPYFLQEWGKHVWDYAKASPITIGDVDGAGHLTLASLDEGFFKVRLERTTPSERAYMMGMARLGAGTHRSGDIAAHLKKQPSTLAPVRSKLIQKGIVWSPAHGDTAFTVPLFNDYLLRTVLTV